MNLLVFGPRPRRDPLLLVVQPSFGDPDGYLGAGGEVEFLEDQGYVVGARGNAGFYSCCCSVIRVAIGVREWTPSFLRISRTWVMSVCSEELFGDPVRLRIVTQVAPY